MKVKRTNLTDELIGFQQSQTIPSRKTSIPIVINYDQIIEKQAHIIQSLFRQCKALRQKINRLKSEQIFSSSHKLAPQKNMDKFAEMIENALLDQIAQLLQIQENQISKTKVIQSIKRLKWQRQKKSEPIFIESKKQVRVPVPVQIIVQKPVQKIVIQQRIIEVPVFRQKIVEKFISKIEEVDYLPSTNSKLSSEEVKKQNSSGVQKSQDSMFLGTQSVLKQKSREKPIRKDSRKSSCQIDNYAKVDGHQKKKQTNLGYSNKNLSFSNIGKDQFNPNIKQYHDNDRSKISQFNSRLNKQNVKSPKYSRINYENYSYDNRQNYNQQQDYDYEGTNDYYQRPQRMQRSYYASSNQQKNNTNKTVISPRNNHQQKYRDEDTKYTFDKNKFLDSSKINHNNRNIKKRDKYQFNHQKDRQR